MYHILTDRVLAPGAIVGSNAANLEGFDIKHNTASVYAFLSLVGKVVLWPWLAVLAINITDGNYHSLRLAALVREQFAWPCPNILSSASLTNPCAARKSVRIEGAGFHPIFHPRSEVEAPWTEPNAESSTNTAFLNCMLADDDGKSICNLYAR